MKYPDELEFSQKRIFHKDQILETKGNKLSVKE